MMPDLNTTDFDFGVPSLRAVAEALSVEAYRLPDGWGISSVDYRDCLKAGRRTGEVIFEGYGPKRVIDLWTDDDGVEQTEIADTLWGFRVVIDQIGQD